MPRMFIALLFSILLPCIPSGAQAAKKRKAAVPKPSAPTSTSWPVESLAVEGNRHFTAEQILAVAGLKIGQKAGKAEFEAARERLLASGAFNSVGYKFAPAANTLGYSATFQVAEVEQMIPVRFEELGVADANIQEWLKQGDPLFGPKIPATQPVIDRYAKRIETLLTESKTPEKVVGAITADDPNQLEVVFRPARNAPIISRVVFTGNSVVPSPLLQNTIAGVATGVAYSGVRMRQLLDSSIRPLYDARGRLRVTFSNVRTERAKDVNGVLVTVEVNEGPSYNLGEVRFEGTSMGSKELAGIANIKTGDIANFQEVEAGAERLKNYFRREGYLRAKTEFERKIDDQKKKVDVVVHVEPGQQFAFQRLDVQGLDIETEPVIRKLWALKPGKPFNPDYPDHFLTQIREQGIFDNLGTTRTESKIDEQNHSVDVILYFQGEGPKPRKTEQKP